MAGRDVLEPEHQERQRQAYGNGVVFVAARALRELSLCMQSRSLLRPREPPHSSTLGCAALRGWALGCALRTGELAARVSDDRWPMRHPRTDASGLGYGRGDTDAGRAACTYE